MAAGRGNVNKGGHADAADLYAVLGLKKECTDAELKVAYRRLAMTWHPDRCSASGSAARVEEAKERFQEIQEAYSVLSDSNKRFLYDVGVYDSEDDEDDLSGMGEFLGEMVDMMSQATPTESFEELQQLFVDMFGQDDSVAGVCSATTPRPGQQQRAPSSVPPPRAPPPRTSPRAPPSRNGFGKRGPATFGSGKPPPLSPRLGLSGFCFKVSETRQRPAPLTSGGDGTRSCCRKQRLSTSRDVSDGFSRQSSSSNRASWQ